ncbi:hypothetical protein ABT061_17300 [Streptosporangium sp. NPDC002544]|uniref:hypothetical protein n=1 Tax=Streptosporangium sp. NPDC002544 TaxID=3154538 RepID=UPI003327BA07
MDADSDLDTALENLYRTFSRYPLPEDSSICDHCVSPESIQAARVAPLRALSASALKPYAANALSTWGDIRDFKHYLPRLLELLISEELDGFYGDMFARVLGGRWRSWPQDEQDTFVAAIDAWWRFTLHHYPRGIDVLEVLKIIVGEFGLDLRTYLAAWEGSAGDEAAALHMAWLVWWFQYELDLDTDWHRSLESWITSPASARIIESALASAGSTEVMEKLRHGLREYEWWDWAQK